ncbi:alpha N-terminal protein methyltransferase 1 isoform X1 [Tanacetum coccineum]
MASLRNYKLVCVNWPKIGYVNKIAEFTPDAGRYDVIWIQWCVGQLADDDFVSFFKKAKVGPKPGGLFILKENLGNCGSLDRWHVRISDSHLYFVWCFYVYYWSQNAGILFSAMVSVDHLFARVNRNFSLFGSQSAVIIFRVMSINELKDVYMETLSLEKAQGGWKDEYEVSSKQDFIAYGVNKGQEVDNFRKPQPGM